MNNDERTNTHEKTPRMHAVAVKRRPRARFDKTKKNKNIHGRRSGDANSETMYVRVQLVAAV